MSGVESSVKKSHGGFQLYGRLCKDVVIVNDAIIVHVCSWSCEVLHFFVGCGIRKSYYKTKEDRRTKATARLGIKHRCRPPAKYQAIRQFDCVTSAGKLVAANPWSPRDPLVKRQSTRLCIFLQKCPVPNLAKLQK